MDVGFHRLIRLSMFAKYGETHRGPDNRNAGPRAEARLIRRGAARLQAGKPESGYGRDPPRSKFLFFLG